MPDVATAVPRLFPEHRSTGTFLSAADVLFGQASRHSSKTTGWRTHPCPTPHRLAHIQASPKKTLPCCRIPPPLLKPPCPSFPFSRLRTPCPFPAVLGIQQLLARPRAPPQRPPKTPIPCAADDVAAEPGRPGGGRGRRPDPGQPPLAPLFAAPDVLLVLLRFLPEGAGRARGGGWL